MKRVVVLDYGSGNLRSAERALLRVGADVVVTADLDAAASCDGLVVPGVGAFAACMGGICELGADVVVRDRVAAERPVLGICVGMQVLFSSGLEHGVQTPGIDVLRGTIDRLEAPIVPHMGWNTVEPPAASLLFAGVESERFYFVHSYAAHFAPNGVETTWATHGHPFVAAVERGALAATQFHPEKSGAAGAQVLANWVQTL